MFTKNPLEISMEPGKKQKTVASKVCCHFLVANPPAHLKNNNAKDDQNFLHQNGNGSQSQFFSGRSPAVVACRCSSCKLLEKIMLETTDSLLHTNGYGTCYFRTSCCQSAINCQNHKNNYGSNLIDQNICS
jgi:hypothetical protein